MTALFQSFLLVAATEMGDKTQLLAFVLASRFKKPGTVLLGILVATIANHLLAAYAGTWVSQAVSPTTLKWALGLTFIGFAAWVLIPDKWEEEGKVESRWGAFVTTTVAFFIAEMGDKTQLSTVALAATYGDLLMVTAGTTLGMMFSDGLAVIFGEKLTKKIPLKYVRYVSAFLFVLFGAWIIWHGL